jgi:type III secretion system needle length determinant
MSLELNASPTPAPREGKVPPQRHDAGTKAEAAADAAEFRRLFEAREDGTEGMSSAGMLAGMSSSFASGLPHALYQPASTEEKGAASTEHVSIPQWAGEMVDKLLVRDSAEGSGQEVRLVMRQSELAGAEIRFRQTAEGLELALISDSPAAAAWLRKAGGELESRLKARLGTDAVRVSVEESSSAGAGSTHRARENRG